MTKILAVAPLDTLFESTAVAVKGLGAWPAVRCKACGWIVTVDHPSKIPPHECPKMYECESATSTKPVKRRSDISFPEGPRPKFSRRM